MAVLRLEMLLLLSPVPAELVFAPCPTSCTDQWAALEGRDAGREGGTLLNARRSFVAAVAGESSAPWVAVWSGAELSPQEFGQRGHCSHISLFVSISESSTVRPNPEAALVLEPKPTVPSLAVAAQGELRERLLWDRAGVWTSSPMRQNSQLHPPWDTAPKLISHGTQLPALSALGHSSQTHLPWNTIS